MHGFDGLGHILSMTRRVRRSPARAVASVYCYMRAGAGVRCTLAVALAETAAT